ncbi:MAG: hypothetical protein FJY95_16205 [Candidatus Handelsmanbacteria bacterium]|nr:hypothetical protein [Candidatus Handelsmanbacteria bacterium]
MRSRTALLALCLAAGCTDRQARNPLDPGATGVDPAVVVGPLEAVAGDGQVQLRWNYQAFEDIAGYRLYRRTGKEEQLPYRELEPADTALVDEAVENGLTYQYQLALLIRGEGERRLTPLRLATPGPQAAWAADPGSGLVWRIAPDNRAPFFAHGRFPGLNGIGVDRRDGSCWVSDASYRGAIRIGADGKLSQHPGRIGEPGPLAVDPQSGEGWLVDRAEQTVLWFALPAGEDSLRFEVVDARFDGLRVLEALDGSCWIGDGERLLRYWRQGNRRREWEVRGTTALAPTREGGAWVLVEQGQGLVYLEPGGGIRELALPFARAQALEADLEGGGCWVGGAAGVVLLDAGGGERVRAEGLGECRGLALDVRRRLLWAATPGHLMVLETSGRLLTRLGGFDFLGGVEMDLGNPR